ncbi:glycine cleavage system H protein [Kwoniella dejecticola CBS 10117]|uniref:Glycine cleavage system H protein n=1 Tax=Kwoniella dejecticola CBS 10117 TaxID=1296121 RepID=A0A1A6A2C6_9TREE|nr:glycine cleavage system H protein [Kwoniella dejecticola CBS 10117]OBR84199.1 glycine cleavage system H protein [Kwoniella dejecticola CBS 10117]
MLALRFARPALRTVTGTPKPALRFSALRFISTRYTTDHEWVAFDSASNIGTVGITDYAQKALGDVVFVELPGQGAEVAQGDSIGAVESVKAASDIYAPVSGVVEEINETLADQPGLLNKAPEGNGWLAKIKLSDPAEFEALLSDEAYKAHCEGQ